MHLADIAGQVILDLLFSFIMSAGLVLGAIRFYQKVRK